MKIFFHDVEISFRMWKYGTDTIANSEFLLYSSLIEMLEFDDDVFAAGNFFTQFVFFSGFGGGVRIQKQEKENVTFRKLSVKVIAVEMCPQSN